MIPDGTKEFWAFSGHLRPSCSDRQWLSGKILSMNGPANRSVPINLTRSTDPAPKAYTNRATGRAISVASWSYLLIAVLDWALLHFGGDRWWLATVLLFAPRWFYGLPLFVLFPLAIWRRRRNLFPLAVASAIWLWPIMGLCVPWPTGAEDGLPKLRVLTCNLHGGEYVREALMNLVIHTEPDVVALEECSGETPLPIPSTWHLMRAGQLVVASRYPLRSERRSFRVHPQSPWPLLNAVHCIVETPLGDIGFCSVHLLTPRQGLDAVLNRRTIVDPARSRPLRTETEYRRRESEELRAWIDGFAGPTIIAGDFNMPIDSSIYRDNWSMRSNAFSVAGLGFGHTKITIKRGFQYGARIDHILFDDAFFGCRNCWVGPDVGSDHLPLLADLVMLPSLAGVVPAAN